MKYPCGIIRDLLPLYIDGVCNEESKTAVESHLSECEKCRLYYEAMKSADGFAQKQNDNSEDMKMAESLKKIKGKINRKTRNIIICAAAAVILTAIAFDVLFSMPLKAIDLGDISVSAEIYPINELESGLVIDDNDNSVRISYGEADKDEAYRITIPSMPEANIALSEEVAQNNGYVTVISWSSPYIMQVASWTEDSDTDTLYVNSFKTTVLNNKASNYTSKQLEFREINKIVFVDGNGRETTLWSR